jgi:hypothetical protein
MAKSKRTKVSLDQFCALLSQDIMLAYSKFDKGKPINPKDPQAEAELRVRIMGYFGDAFGKALARYETPGEPIAVFGLAVFRDKVEKRVIKYLETRWRI